MPAVAVYDYDACDFRDDILSFDDQDGENQVHQASHSHEHAILASASAADGATGSVGSGGKSSVGSGGGYVGDDSSNRFVRRTSGGGSGSGAGGTHQCPKCGAHVTFHEPTASSSNNSITGNQNNNGNATPNNCFYCAACSGWFLIPPNSNITNDDDVSTAQSKYLMSKLALGSSGTGIGAGAGGGGEDTNKATGFPTTPSNRKIPQSQFVMQHVSLALVLSDSHDVV